MVPESISMSNSVVTNKGIIDIGNPESTGIIVQELASQSRVIIGAILTCEFLL